MTTPEDYTDPTGTGDPVGAAHEPISLTVERAVELRLDAIVKSQAELRALLQNLLDKVFKWHEDTKKQIDMLDGAWDKRFRRLERRIEDLEDKQPNGEHP